MAKLIARPTTAAGRTGPNWGLTKFLDPLPIPSTIRPDSQRAEITIHMVRTRARLHSQLPPTTVWAYSGRFPGPTIEVQSGCRLRVTWSNAIEGALPLVAVIAPAASGPTNSPGYRDSGGALLPGHETIDGVADLPSWTVVHLHGAHTNGGNDGWTHSGGLASTSQLTEYQNRQPSAALWYHDHAAGITRFNVHTGLAGMYLVRDEEEEALGLPRGDREIPLVICDRNLDTDPATGALTGQLLFKVPYVLFGENKVPAGFSGPFNLVNGVIWPHVDVDARWYRFRVLNACNARYYTLNLVDEAGEQHNDAVRLIGTDSGLLPAPAPLPAGGITIAPAERFDILVDFSRFHGQKLRLTDARTATGPAEPDLMEFRVEGGACRVDDLHRPDPFQLPETISSSYVRLVHGATLPEDHDHVWVALLINAEGHPEMWDLEELEADPGGEGVLQINDPATGTTRTFRRVGKLFDDTVGVFINHNRWAVWNFIHVASIGPVHPMHIHLTKFQALFRRSFTTTFDLPTGRTTAPLDGFTDVPLEKYEEGWKDTINVNRGQWVSVAGRFDGGTGEYMFHCHILDHEDDGMMRPFIVHPPEVAKFHPHGMGGHHH